MSMLPNSPAFERLPIPGRFEPICCTPGLVARRLTEQFRNGAPTLNAALAHWLIPRHAQRLQESVDAGRILLWIRLDDSDHERRVCRRLLASKSHSVEVHDLVDR